MPYEHYGQLKGKVQISRRLLATVTGALLSYIETLNHLANSAYENEILDLEDLVRKLMHLLKQR